MSTTHSIACVECKKHLWMAQSSQGSGYVYAGKEQLESLWGFLNAHFGHHLVFGVNSELPIAEYEEVQAMSQSEQKSVDQAVRICPNCQYPDAKLIGEGFGRFGLYYYLTDCGRCRMTICLDGQSPPTKCKPSFWPFNKEETEHLLSCAPNENVKP